MSFEHLSGMMIDLETMGCGPTAAIVSIGAVMFDVDKKSLYDDFYITIDAKSSKEHGLTFDKSTVEWWSSQNKEALRAITKNTVSLPEAIDKLSDYMKKHSKSPVWAWGSNFDLPVIESSFRACGITKLPWRYYDVRCARTVAKIFGAEIDRSSGVHHNALDDAKAQALFIIKLFNEM